MKKYIFITLSIIAAFLLGYFIHKPDTQIVTTETIKYVTRPTITEYVQVHTPVFIRLPDVHDTLIVLREKEDTLNAIKDWMTYKQYEETLFDSDSLGTCIVKAGVQYNKLDSLSYTFTPITMVKEVVRTVEKKAPLFTPFIGGGVMASYIGDEAPVGAYITTGLYIKDKWGIQLSGDTRKEIMIGINYKF